LKSGIAAGVLKTHATPKKEITLPSFAALTGPSTTVRAAQSLKCWDIGDQCDVTCQDKNTCDTTKMAKDCVWKEKECGKDEGPCVTLAFTGVQNAKKKNWLLGGCSTTGLTCEQTKKSFESKFKNSALIIEKWDCSRCTEDLCNPKDEITLPSFADLTGSFTTEVKDCATAKDMVEDADAAKAFAAGIKSAAATKGKVSATLSTTCSRRLIEESFVPVRRLSKGDLKCEYELTLAPDETFEAMKTSMEGDAMKTLLKQAISQNLPPAFANANLADVTGMTAEKPLSASPGSEMEVNKAISQAGSVVLLILLVGLLW